MPSTSKTWNGGIESILLILLLSKHKITFHLGMGICANNMAEMRASSNILMAVAEDYKEDEMVLLAIFESLLAC